MWIFIETLHGIDAATVVAIDGVERDWTAPKRLPQGHKLLPLLAETYHKKATVVDVAFPGDQLVVVHPVIGADHDVYALHVSMGPQGEEPTPKPPAAGNRWILDQQCIHQTAESFEMSGGGEGFHEYRSAQQFTGRQLRSDGAADVAMIGLAPTADKKIIIDASIYNVATAQVMPWLMICRGIDGNIMRILFYDTGQFGIEPKLPTPEALGLRALSAAVGRYGALAATVTDAETQRRDIFVVKWLGELPPWFEETSPRSTDFIHPDDRRHFAAANMSRTDIAFADQTYPLRIRAATGGWHPMQSIIRPYAIPGGSSIEDFYIVEMWEADQANT